MFRPSSFLLRNHTIPSIFASPENILCSCLHSKVSHIRLQPYCLRNNMEDVAGDKIIVDTVRSLKFAATSSNDVHCFGMVGCTFTFSIIAVSSRSPNEIASKPSTSPPHGLKL